MAKVAADTIRPVAAADIRALRSSVMLLDAARILTMLSGVNCRPASATASLALVFGAHWRPVSAAPLAAFGQRRE